MAPPPVSPRSCCRGCPVRNRNLTTSVFAAKRGAAPRLRHRVQCALCDLTPCMYWFRSVARTPLAILVCCPLDKAKTPSETIRMVRPLPASAAWKPYGLVFEGKKGALKENIRQNRHVNRRKTKSWDGPTPSSFLRNIRQNRHVNRRKTKSCDGPAPSS